MKLILALLIGVTLVSGCLSQNLDNETSSEKPGWVTEIENKVDSTRCGPDNCEACDAQACTFDECEVAANRYECGPRCTAAIQYCVTREQQTTTTLATGLAACGTDKEFFTTSPIQLTEFMGLVPLGNVAPSGHVFPTDHMYFHINRIDKEQWDLGTISANVYAPGDIVITEIHSTEYLDEGYTDYGLEFSPCSEINAFFIHLTTLSERIEQEIGNYDICDDHVIAGKPNTYCSKRGLSIELTAGELIGTAGGNERQNALDLGLYDTRVDALVYANPARWTERTLHNACPIDYFTQDVRDALLAKIGNHDASTARTVEPLCGTIGQDAPGTAQGMWFAKGTTNTYPEDPHIALIHDNVNPNVGLFSVGTSVTTLQSGVYYFTPVSTGLVNRDFPDVTESDVYCFDNLRDRFDNPISDKKIIVQLTSATTMQIESQSGSCGSGLWTFTSATEFER